MEPRHRQPFTIALPVRNGGAYLRPCVESILAQRCGDFALAILDNASDDEGAEFLRTLRDRRVIVYRSERLLSIEENWARIRTLPKNEFLTTIGHDDLLDPDFLDVVASLIQRHPDAGLYLTHFRLIDSAGAFLRHCRPMPARETAAEFVAVRLCNLRDSFGTGHVLRSAAYDALGGIPPYRKLLHADDALFVQAIGPTGYRATAPEEAFSYRWHVASAGGGCTMEEFCAGLEPYADLLAGLSERDPALARVLRRWFASCAVHWGRRWRREALLAAYRAGGPLSPEVERRIHRLVTRFDPSPDLPPEQEPFESRLLERASYSRVARSLYAGLDAARRGRALAARWAHRKP